MNRFRLCTLGLFSCMAGVPWVACAPDNALVGGRCRDGYIESSRTCIPDPAYDPADASYPGPGGPTDSSSRNDRNPGDASRSDMDGTDGAHAADGSTDAAMSDDAGPVDANAPDSSDSPDASADASNPDASADASADASTDAAQPPACTFPLVSCRNTCIPVDSDGRNCGACGKVCPSNICVAGECQGATPGHVVVIGHNFLDAFDSSAQVKVLSNALSIPTSDPIRILSFEEGAATDEVTQTKALAATGIPRELAFSTATERALTSSRLNLSYDVVLLFDAAGARPGVLGGRWATSLQTFAQKGGVVVALDGAASGMPELISATGLLSLPSHTRLADGVHMLVTNSGDVVGSQVISPYAAFGAAVSFPGAEAEGPNLSWIVQADSTSDPLVIHKVIR